MPNDRTATITKGYAIYSQSLPSRPKLPDLYLTVVYDMNGNEVERVQHEWLNAAFELRDKYKIKKGYIGLTEPAFKGAHQ